jgi:hypothetical protein
MYFEKGNKINVGRTPWNKGTRGIMKAWNKGLKGYHAGEKHYRYGKHCSEETKQKISIANKGKISANKGNKWSSELRIKLSGANASNWKGGTTKERDLLKNKTEYILWRTAVFMRDNYTCQECLVRGGELNADHIKPWSLFPELRYAIDNGRTLCVNCHRQTDTWGVNMRFKRREDFI